MKCGKIDSSSSVDLMTKLVETEKSSLLLHFMLRSIADFFESEGKCESVVLGL